MGGTHSAPAPAPAPVPAPLPKSEVGPVPISAERQGQPRIAGVSISESSACPGSCVLEFQPGISSSSARLTREFGSVAKCNTYGDAWDAVRLGKMSAQDLLGRMQAGKLNERKSDDPNYCSEVRFPDDVVKKIRDWPTLRDHSDERYVVRVRQVVPFDFSRDTKAVLTPSIPLSMTFDGREIPIRTITVYHPSPLRIQDVQHDAVISLNDPAFYGSGADGVPVTILIPITTGDGSTPSAKFFSRIANQISAIAQPDPMDGQYPTTDIQTGNEWGLSQLFNVSPVSGGKAPVTDGFFTWKGDSGMDGSWMDKIRTPDGKSSADAFKPTYIMMEKALPVSSSDLATLRNSLPVTDWKSAIHSILPTVKYKMGPAQNCPTSVARPTASPSGPKREKFTDVQDMTCDPFLNNVNAASTRQYTTDDILRVVFWVFTAIAAFVGAYIAVAAVARMYDVEYADFSKSVGKLMAVFAKNLQAKAGAVSKGFSSLKTIASPGGVAALASGALEQQKNGLLGDVAKVQDQALGAVAQRQADLNIPIQVPSGIPTPAEMRRADLNVPIQVPTTAPLGALTDMVQERIPELPPTATPPAPEPAPAPAAPASRAVSPGIAARMQNFTSNAAVTPEGQATRKLFNTNRTFGRARPDRGRGASTQRARR